MSTQNGKKTGKEVSFRAKQIKSLIRNFLNLSLMKCFVLSFGCILLNGCSPIRLGSVLVLEGQEEALGNNMRLGLEAAFKDKRVKGRKIEIIFQNDYYEPDVAEQKTEELINSGILLMIGNVGTPTAKKTLPKLTDDNNNIPAVGFLTGAQDLRNNSQLIINYRASYKQEIEKVVEIAANKKHIKPSEICAYVQNDEFGMSVLEDLRDSLRDRLEKEEAQEKILGFYNQYFDLKNKERKRNEILGPVGFYSRNTPDVEPGYKSLEDWEKKYKKCKLVVTAGTSSNISGFINHARENKKDWLISSLSFAHAQELKLDLEEYGIENNVILTQVVPSLESLDIVKEAKSKLKDKFNNVSLEGYIVGKMTLKILQKIRGKINRKNFLKAAKSKFDLGGVCIDLTQGRTQASDLVLISELKLKGKDKDTVFEKLDDSDSAQHNDSQNNCP